MDSIIILLGCNHFVIKIPTERADALDGFTI
jgi:hypothetical protein